MPTTTMATPCLAFAHHVWCLGSGWGAACWPSSPDRSAVLPAARVAAPTAGVKTSGRRVVWSSLPRLFPLPACRQGPPWRSTPLPSPPTWSSTAMKTELPSNADAVNKIRAAVDQEPSAPALKLVGDAACDSLDFLDIAVAFAQSAVEAVDEVVDWGSIIDRSRFLSDNLLWCCESVDLLVEEKLLRVALSGEVIQRAVMLVVQYEEAVQASARLLSVASFRAFRAWGRCEEGATESKGRLMDVNRLLLGLRDDILREHVRSLSGQAARLQAAFAELRPVAAALPGHFRLPAGHHRSPSSTLVLVPSRETAVCIPRDDKVVQTLVHLSNFHNPRIVSAVVSSPGVGKSHLVWDLVDALGSLDDARLATAAERAGVSGWRAARDDLRGTQPCIITFNSGSLWGSLDKELMDACLSTQRAAAYLPLYARALWFLRCADVLRWGDFVRLLINLLKAGTTTAAAIIQESLAALAERPALVIVEELNKITGTWPASAGKSPAEAAAAARDKAAAGNVLPKDIKQRNVGPSGTQSSDTTSQSILDVYRHELCTWTTIGVSVLFTAPYFGLIWDEIKDHLSDQQRLLIDRLVADSGATLDPSLLRDAQARLSSLSSQRQGSPFFVLSAVNLGFMDMEELAKVYFQPLFESEWLLRGGLASENSYDVPSDVAGRVLARLSGGHPRSAGFLRLYLKQATSGPTWASIVEPASAALAVGEGVSTLLDCLSVTPVVIIAALHQCTIVGERAIVDGVVPPVHVTWESLFSSNALVASAADTNGVYKDPCMPPLLVLALRQRWEWIKGDWAKRPGLYETFLILDGIMTALAVVCGARYFESPSSSVWEYTTLYADVALTRLRAAAKKWAVTSSGFLLPHDYAAVTLLQLYPGTTKYYVEGEQPLLNKKLFNALDATGVNEDEAANELPTILQLSFSALVTTVFKCSPDQRGFDSIKFLAPAGSSGTRDKSTLVAVAKSNKFTGLAKTPLTVEQHVRSSLKAIEKAFGQHWEEWRHRVVLVVETNLTAAGTPQKVLTAAESARVIIITAEDHLNVYGRAMSGFFAAGPTMYSSSVVNQVERSL